MLLKKSVCDTLALLWSIWPQSNDQYSSRKASKKEKEARWREWMVERIRRRREGQAGQGEGRGEARLNF